MKRTLSLVVVALLIVTTAFYFIHRPSRTARYFNRIKNNPQELYLFLSKMPKGGELHYHISGGTYAENLFADGLNNKNLCVNLNTYDVSINPTCPNDDKLSTIYQNPDLYEKVINAWSLRNSSTRDANSTTNAHYHFFDTFLMDESIVTKDPGKILAEILNRAGMQHEDYMELMTMADNADVLSVAQKVSWNGDYKILENNLMSADLGKVILEIHNNIVQREQSAQQLMHCGAQDAGPGCHVVHRYLYLALRLMNKQSVFAQLYAGFQLANQYPDQFVGINIVGAEDNPTALNDYDAHMRMIAYLHQQFPNVHITLHAGELRTGLVPPEDLQFHVRDAVEIALAERIGHGVDIAQENNAGALLDEMAKKHILVETNLTSNAELLGVQGADQPLKLWLRHRVPVALSTDDEGVFRTYLTREYQRAVLTYGLSYAQIKNMARNVLSYSFLPGQSLWDNDQSGTPMNDCRDSPLGGRPSMTCQNFLNHSQKAQMQWKLEHEFNDFEKQY